MENKEKSMFQEARMKLKLTRNKVADLSDGFFNESRLEKIETGKLEIHPEEVVKLAEIYKDKELCSTFCATECPVGIKRGMKVVKEKNLSQIVLEMLATLQSLDEKKVRLIEMTVDGKIDDKEIRLDTFDFCTNAPHIGLGIEIKLTINIPQALCTKFDLLSRLLPTDIENCSYLRQLG